MTLLLQAEGDSAALSAIDAYVARWGYGTSLILIHAVHRPAFRARAAEVARADSARFGPTFGRMPYANRLWYHGAVAVAEGRLPLARAVATELERRAAQGAAPGDALYARSLRARLTLAEGDTARAFLMLDELVPAPMSGDLLFWEDAAPLAVERLTLARLLLARGETLRALAVADAFDSPRPPPFSVPLLPASLEFRAAAAESIGDIRRAQRYRARLAAVRDASGRAAR